MPPFHALLLVVDIVIRNPKGQVLLLKRNIDPYRGSWVVSGGHVEEGETVVEAAMHEVKEEAGLDVSPEQLKLVGVFSDPSRDPRTDYRRVAIGYLVEVSADWKPALNYEASEWKWAHPKRLRRSDVGFDHFQLITEAVSRYPLT